MFQDNDDEHIMKWPWSFHGEYETPCSYHCIARSSRLTMASDPGVHCIPKSISVMNNQTFVGVEFVHRSHLWRLWLRHPSSRIELVKCRENPCAIHSTKESNRMPENFSTKCELVLPRLWQNRSGRMSEEREVTRTSSFCKSQLIEYVNFQLQSAAIKQCLEWQEDRQVIEISSKWYFDNVWKSSIELIFGSGEIDIFVNFWPPLNCNNSGCFEATGKELYENKV